MARNNQRIDNNREYPTVICRLVDSLNSQVDEVQVADAIDRLNQAIGKIESASGPSKRTLGMRQEVARLESLLDYSRQHLRIRGPRYPATPGPTDN